MTAQELLSSAQNSTYGYMCCVSAAFFTAAALLCVRTLSVLDEAPHHAREAFHWGNLCGSLALGLPHGASACKLGGSESPAHPTEAGAWTVPSSSAYSLSSSDSFQGFLWPNRSELLWILATALSMQLAQLALTQVLRNPMVSAAKYSFLTIVLNLGFGIIMGDPWPCLREWLGAAVVVLSMIFSEVPAKPTSAKA